MLTAPAPAGPYMEEPPSSVSDDDDNNVVVHAGQDTVHLDEVYNMQTRLIEQATRFTDIINQQTKLINHLKQLGEAPPPTKQNDEPVKHIEKRRKIEPPLDLIAPQEEKPRTRSQPESPEQADMRVILDFVRDVIFPMRVRGNPNIRVLINEFCDKYNEWATQKGFRGYNKVEITKYLTEHPSALFRQVRMNRGYTFVFDYFQAKELLTRRVVITSLGEAIVAPTKTQQTVESIVTFVKSALIDKKVSIEPMKCTEFLDIYTKWCGENRFTPTRSAGYFSKAMSDAFPTGFKSRVIKYNWVLTSFDHIKGSVDYNKKTI
jgi:hypothetical protein